MSNQDLRSLRLNALSVVVSALLATGAAVAQTLPFAVAPTQPGMDELAAAQDPGLLLTRAGIFDPLAEQLDAGRLGLPETTGGRYALLQFHPDAKQPLTWLRQQGIDVLEYLPHHAWRVRLNGVGLDLLRALPEVRHAGPVPNLLRMDPELWPQSRASTLQRNDVEHVLQLSLYPGENALDVLAAVAKLAPSLAAVDYLDRGTQPWVRLTAADADQGAIEALLGIEAIAWIAPYQRPELRNQSALGPMQNNALTSGGVPIFDRGLTGAGQIIAVADSGLDRNEDWFVDIDFGAGPLRFITPADSPVPPLTGATHPQAKVFGYWVQPGATAYDNNLRCTPTSAFTGFHGTHVNGTVAGDRGSIATPQLPARDPGDGMAPNAQILFQDIGNDTSGCLSIADFSGTLAQASAGGARVHNNSWGSNSAGAYGGSDIAADASSRELRNILVVVAAGNSGAGGATTIGSPANAKNALSVGALGNGNALTIASFSSRGPTRDGRIKPDIVAPGSSTVSAAGDTNNGNTVEAGLTSSKSGTSMASPTITGSAALARQYFTDGFYPSGIRTPEDAHQPSAQVLKAVLLNSTRAIELSGAWPNNTYGWGRLWLEHSLYFSGLLPGGTPEARRLRVFERTDDTGLATGDSHAYSLANVAAGQELRFTLTWFDPAAAPAAAVTLINDLDLEVVGPDSTLYFGNVFTAGVSTAGGQADRRNTVEQVRFTAPAAGSYTVRVRGFNVPGSALDGSTRQGYGLVASGAFGLPETQPLAATGQLAVGNNDLDGVAVTFAAVPTAQTYQLYRASGSCSSANPAQFHMVAHGPASPLVDTSTIGGYGYAYQLRAVGGDVEGLASTCVDVISAAACTLTPSFSMASASVDASNKICGVSLTWDAGASRCPLATDMSYRIERATRPDFNGAVVLSEALTTPTFSDGSVLPNQPYFYRVSAADAAGNRRTDPRVLNATPASAAGPSGVDFLDDVDTRSYAQLQQPWQFSTQASAGSFSYHNAPDGQNYAANVCASLTLPPLQLNTDARLDYKARFDIEVNWDGVVAQISSDGGQTWASLPPDAGFPGSFADTGNPPANACGFPASQTAFSGSSGGQFRDYSSNLAAFVGQTVQIRWLFSSDSSAEEAGFYVDAIRVTGDATSIFASSFESAEVALPPYVGPSQCSLPN